MEAFGIAVLTDQKQKNHFAGNGYKGCLIDVKEQPKFINLQVQARGNGVTPIAIYGSKPFEYDNQLDFTLKVPVVWWPQHNSVLVPHTRQAGLDNMDALLIDSNLHFTDVQVSLLSRKGKFYIVVQKVYEGWIRVIEDEVSFIPSDPVYAYPGADYRGTWEGMGNILSTMARVVDGAVNALGESFENPTPAVWEPQEISKLDRWKRGHILFFNPITNTGLLLGEDGVTYHLYGGNFVDVEGPVHMMSPMAPVYFRSGKQEEGYAYPPVRSCKLA